MSSDDSVSNHHDTVAVKPPATVWIITLLMGVMAFVCVVGSLLFAFPLGGMLDYIVGTLLLVVGIGYVIIVWRLRHGERAVWVAALVLPIFHTLGLNTLNLVCTGPFPARTTRLWEWSSPSWFSYCCQPHAASSRSRS